MRCWGVTFDVTFFSGNVTPADCRAMLRDKNDDCRGLKAVSARTRAPFGKSTLAKFNSRSIKGLLFVAVSSKLVTDQTAIFARNYTAYAAGP